MKFEIIQGKDVSRLPGKIALNIVYKKLKCQATLTLVYNKYIRSRIKTLQNPDHSKVVSRDSLEGIFEVDGFSFPTEAFLWGPVFVLLGLGESSGGPVEVRFSGVVEGCRSATVFSSGRASIALIARSMYPRTSA